MIRVELEHIGIDRLFTESTMPVEILNLMATCGKRMHIIGGYVDNKIIFHTGIIDYAPLCGEVWSQIESDDYQMVSAWNIRDLIDHIALHYKYKEIVSSIEKGSSQLWRWSEWLGLEYIGSTEEYDHFKWRRF